MASWHEPERRVMYRPGFLLFLAVFSLACLGLGAVVFYLLARQVPR